MTSDRRSGEQPRPDAPHLDRDRYVQLVLNAFEQDLIEPSELEHRLDLLESADSDAEMKKVVEQMAIKGTDAHVRSPSRVTEIHTSGGQVAAAGPDAGSTNGNVHPQRRALDPVDLAMLKAGSKRRIAPAQDHRWSVLVAVGLLFVMLIAVGIFLMMTIHAPPSSSSSPDMEGSFLAATLLSLLNLNRH